MNLHIQNHRLQGEGIQHLDSPNRGDPFAPGLPDTLLLHYTASGSMASAVGTLIDPERKASAHLIVGRDGSLVQLLPFHIVGWHAGVSAWEGRTGINRFSIGIEMENAGWLEKVGEEYRSWFGRLYPEEEVLRAMHRNEQTPRYWHRYTTAQIEQVEAICALLLDAYPIQYILGHEEVSPGRKTDPGPAFPLDALRQRLLGPGAPEETGERPEDAVVSGPVPEKPSAGATEAPKRARRWWFLLEYPVHWLIRLFQGGRR